MTNIVIPETLRQSLPHDFDVERATVTTYGALSKAHDVSGYEGMKIADDAVVVLAPGFTADDGNCDVDYSDAETAEAAALEYVNTGEWGEIESAMQVEVKTWRVAYTLDVDNVPVKLGIDRRVHTVEINADGSAALV